MPEPIIVPAALRPWLKFGLSALLLESPERVAELRADTLRAVPTGLASKSGRQASVSLGTKPAASAPQVVEHPRSFPGSPVPPQNTPNTPILKESAHASKQMPPAAVTPTIPSGTSAAILPLAEWPAPWIALKNRRPLPPRPLVFWTYAGLGDDLMGTADAARQQAIVRLLTALHHPGGTHVFWPCTLPEYADNSPSLFWSGVELLKPRVILVFGSEARDSLGLPKTLLPFGQDRIHGRLIVQLHQPASLVDDESLRRATAFLSRLLDFCAPR